ncbi:AAA family ATPase [Nonomuraea sp. NPDC004580]|uniref:AAA family ATPase n=1 Tax=Nonomuraea sp. NPDC004580 TaxID=3154552 RepID=UPI0033A4E263
MPYPSIDLLAAAADGLRDRDPLAVISIPALLRGARRSGIAPTDLQKFGSREENDILNAFKVGEGSKPFLAVWNQPPQMVRRDYSGSTLQAKRTRDALGRAIFSDKVNPQTNKRTHFGLKSDAGIVLGAERPKVPKICLAAWLGRKEDVTEISDLLDWFDDEFPLDGTDLDAVYTSDIPAEIASLQRPLSVTLPTNEEILARLGVKAPVTSVPETVLAQATAATVLDDDLEWTRDVCVYTLRNPNPQAIAEEVLADLERRNIELPDAARLVRRCVTALLLGHLILQGPPGTGKTTLARALARGFRAQLIESTATSDWSPYHVVGGLRPNAAGGLSPSYGKVAQAALSCAEIVRDAANAEAAEVDRDDPALFDLNSVASTSTGDLQAAWLFIDEFNRADIDKAIGSLYTMLSSCDPEHLHDTPIDLWFETTPGRGKLWVPARFRIIGAMNDLDTSFVNRISQGLTRRFQFIHIGVPKVTGTEQVPISSELESAFAGAYASLDRTYGSALTLPVAEDLRSKLDAELQILQSVVDHLRKPNSGAGWPVGTAQIVDVLRTVQLQSVANNPDEQREALDFALADLLVPQMSFMDDAQFESFSVLFEEHSLVAAHDALRHLFNPHTLS